MQDMLSQNWDFMQGKLFPIVEEVLGPISDKHKQLVSAIGFAECRKFIKAFRGCVGRPQKDRESIAHAFIAKAIFNISQTKTLLVWIKNDANLRCLCGWETISSIPSEATFSRAFAEFAKTNIAAKMHEAFVKKYHSNHVIWNVSRDSTEIVAREKVAKKKGCPAKEVIKAPLEPSSLETQMTMNVTEMLADQVNSNVSHDSTEIVAREKAATEPKTEEVVIAKVAKKKGRPAKGTIKEPLEPSRLEKQLNMNVAEMLADLPKECDVGCKTDSKGYKHSWSGYKLHVDTGDGDIPISAVLTSASLHDSQVAIALSKITRARLLDWTYDTNPC